MKGSFLVHRERKVPPRRSSGDPRLIEAVSSHVERHIGPIGWVLHEIESDLVHLDLLWVQPGPHGEFHTWITCGMSERAMTPPARWTGCRHAELVLRLPPSWKLGPEDLLEERNRWPLREMEHLARLPHLYSTWLWYGHTVSNGDPPEPLCASTRFSGTILTPPHWAPSGFHTLAVDPGRSVHFFSVIPLYDDELLLARDGGSKLVFERFERSGVSDLLHEDRPSVVGNGA